MATLASGVVDPPSPQRQFLLAFLNNDGSIETRPTKGLMGPVCQREGAPVQPCYRAVATAMCALALSTSLVPQSSSLALRLGGACTEEPRTGRHPAAGLLGHSLAPSRTPRLDNFGTFSPRLTCRPRRQDGHGGSHIASTKKHIALALPPGTAWISSAAALPPGSTWG